MIPDLRDRAKAWLRQKFASPPPPAEAEPREPDVALYHRIFEFLPYEPVGRFLQQHNFAGSFDIREWAGIHDYLTYSDSPECRFLDSNLESIRTRLTRDLGDFLSAAHGNVWSSHAENQMGVPDEWLNEKHPRYGEYWPAVKQLNGRARKAYEAYSLLLQKGKAKLL